MFNAQNLIIVIFLQGLYIISMDGNKRRLLTNADMRGSSTLVTSCWTLIRGSGMNIWHRVAYGECIDRQFTKSNINTYQYNNS